MGMINVSLESLHDDNLTPNERIDKLFKSMAIEAKIGVVDGFDIKVESKDFQTDSHKAHIHVIHDGEIVAYVDLPPKNSTELDAKDIIVEKNTKYRGKENVDNAKFKKKMVTWLEKEKNGETNLERSWKEWEKTAKGERTGRIGKP